MPSLDFESTLNIIYRNISVSIRYWKSFGIQNEFFDNFVFKYVNFIKIIKFMTDEQIKPQNSRTYVQVYCKNTVIKFWLHHVWKLDLKTITFELKYEKIPAQGCFQNDRCSKKVYSQLKSVSSSISWLVDPF